jgi:hypothetical protein
MNKLEFSSLIETDYAVTEYQARTGWGRLLGGWGGGGVTVKRMLCDRDCKGTALSSRPNWVPPIPSPARSVAPPSYKGGDTLAYGAGDGGTHSDEGTDTLLLCVYYI